MIERAVILSTGNDESILKVGFKIFIMLNRIFYPQFIVISLISILFFYAIHIKVSYFFYVLSFLEVIFFSIAWHECIHISFAKFLNYDISFISFVPCSIGVRTHFDRKRKIEEADKIGILLSAPIILILIGTIAIVISVKWVHSNTFMLFIIAFLLMNVLSMLPLKRCDGGRAYIIVRRLGFNTLKLCMMAITVYMVYIFGFKYIIPENFGTKDNKMKKDGEPNE